MKDLTKTVTAFFLLILAGSISFAQTNADSVRIVNEALKMIAFPEPQFSAPLVSNPGPKEIADMGFEQPNVSEIVQFEMRDGILIHGQKYEYSSNKTVLLLHGTLSSSFTFNKMAGLLREALQANVIAIDIRGHGQSGGVPGDISTLNQYAEDLDGIISIVKSEKPDQKIVLAGHSMGGGIVLRHAETFPETQADGYLLFAPNLGTRAPTTSQKLDLENKFIKIHLSRGLGLRMLNEFGIHTYDSMRVVFYNLPEQMPVRAYSYRSMEASVPIDYRKALKSIKKPLLVLAGSNDEAFIAGEYEPIVEAYSSGECYIVEGETHNGIRHSQQAMEKVYRWAVKNQLR